MQIANNWIGSGGEEGILLSGTSEARVENNLVFSNGAGGILLRNAPGVAIVNNLIYANANDGVAIGVGTNLPSPNALVSNNTLYANVGWGVTIGTAGAPSMGTVILNNILDRNTLGGIAADLGSLADLTIGFNLNNDGYSHEVTPSVTDFAADPRFLGPSGPDGILGGDGFQDDDFHLDPTSAAVDSGSAAAAVLGITGSAVTGLGVDEGIVDLGFHYGAVLREVGRKE
jgi:parallel beta-helix repeat protein